MLTPPGLGIEGRTGSGGYAWPACSCVRAVSLLLDGAGPLTQLQPPLYLAGGQLSSPGPPSENHSSFGCLPEERSYSAAGTDVRPPQRPGPPARPGPLPRQRRGRKGQEGARCHLQSEAVLGPDAPPHPLHVAEEHDDAEEREVAGDAYEGAGDGEVVQQVPEAGSRDSKGAVQGTSLLLRAGLSSDCTSPSLGAFTQAGGQREPHPLRFRWSGGVAQASAF